MRVLRVIVLAAILSVCVAQSMDEESGFPNLFNLLPGPQFLSQPSMLGDEVRQPSFFSFRNFFSLSDEQDQSEAMPQMSIRVRIQEQEDNEEVSPLSNIMSMFSRLTNLMDSLDEKESVLSENTQEPKQRRVCPFMRACGDDIEAFCHEEAKSGVRGRVSACLVDNASRVSRKCADLLEKHRQEHKEEEKVEKPVSEPEEAHPCSEAIAQCKVDNDNMVSIMICLHKKRDTLSTVCVNALESKPGFMCAPDIEKYCPTARGHALERCLTTHDVSPQCKSVIPKQPTPAPITHDVPKPVITGHAPSVSNTHKAAAKTPTHPAGFDLNMKVVAIAVGVALSVIVALVVVLRRRRRRRRAQQEEYHTIQLVNPSQKAVDITPSEP